MLARTHLIDPARLDAGVEATATTSPAGAILASTEVARALLERDGEQLLGRAIAAVRVARTRLREVKGLVGLDGPDVDPLKLTLCLHGTGGDGIAIEQDLLARGLPVEAAERDLLVAVVSLADDERSVGALTEALLVALERRRGVPRAAVGLAAYSVETVQAMAPREAFSADVDVVPLLAAVGRVSAELIAPYPLGVPVLAPGELVSFEAVQELLQACAAGVRIAYAADSTLTTLQVVR